MEKRFKSNFVHKILIKYYSLDQILLISRFLIVYFIQKIIKKIPFIRRIRHVLLIPNVRLLFNTIQEKQTLLHFYIRKYIHINTHTNDIRNAWKSNVLHEVGHNTITNKMVRNEYSIFLVIVCMCCCCCFIFFFCLSSLFFLKRICFVVCHIVSISLELKTKPSDVITYSYYEKKNIPNLFLLEEKFQTLY